MISFAILTHNEGESLKELILRLKTIMRDDDEIIVVDDNSDDALTLEILHESQESGIVVKTNNLNKDFAAQKNYLNSLCTQPWIVNIDADELLAPHLAVNIHTILENNNNVEAIWLPRINIVNGLTQEDITKWKWNVNDKGHVNFPDPQLRVYKNKPEIKWEGKVHERLVGYKTISTLPFQDEYCLIHKKDIDRQRKQNEFYGTI